MKIAPCDEDRLADSRPDLLSGSDGVLEPTDAGQEDDELVPAYACSEVVGAHALLYSSGHVLQDFIPDLMTKGIVDGLEVIDIAEQHGHASAGAAWMVLRGIEALHDLRPVEQSGERIQLRPPLEILFGLDDAVDGAKGLDEALLVSVAVDEAASVPSTQW